VNSRVAATGEPPLTYQWHKDGAPIAGATNPLYVIPNIAKSDEGLYFCVVTNECGSDTSRAVWVQLSGISEPAVLTECSCGVQSRIR
jgi:beta-galactosidase